MPWPPQAVALSMAHCRRCVRERARNFYYGLRLTPEPRRSALYAFYAWSRLADDLADGPEHNADASDPNRRFRQSRTSVAAGGRNADEVAERVHRLDLFWAQTQRCLTGDVTPVDMGTPPASATEAETSPPWPGLWPAFALTAMEHGLSAELLRPMYEGQRADLMASEIATFDDLERYCFRVAGCVGLVCVRIWGLRSTWSAADARQVQQRNHIYRTRILPELINPGHRSDTRRPSTAASARGSSGPGDGAVIADLPPEIAQLAEWRGYAFQLTNILRDFAEDHDAGRTYLPTTVFDRFGTHPEDLRDWARPRSCESIVRQMLAVAHGYYLASLPLEKAIDAACTPTLAAMTRIYRSLLLQIDAAPDIIARGPRPRVRRAQKLRIALQAMLAQRRPAAPTSTSTPPAPPPQRVVHRLTLPATPPISSPPETQAPMATTGTAAAPPSLVPGGQSRSGSHA